MAAPAVHFSSMPRVQPALRAELVEALNLGIITPVSAARAWAAESIEFFMSAALDITWAACFGRACGDCSLCMVGEEGLPAVCESPIIEPARIHVSGSVYI